VTPFWLYRAGVDCRCFGPHRVLFSETWRTEDPPVSTVNTRAGLNLAAQRLHSIFGFTSNEPVWFSRSFWEQLWPKPSVLENVMDVELAQLNPAAPEACFRLQRVGASSALGLIRVPICSDLSFTDLPHRRHVDVATLAPLMAANLGSFPMSFASGGRTYTNVIFNRRDFTYEPVASYRLLESTCRVWQRWRLYDNARLNSDRSWPVPEPDNRLPGR